MQRYHQEWVFESNQMTALVLLHKELMRGLADVGNLSVTQYRVMLKIHELSDRARIRDVAAGLNIPSQSVTRAVDRLEAEKLVRRSRDRKDGRAIYVVITPKGEGLLASADEALGQHLGTLWAPLPHERAETAQRTVSAIGAMLQRSPMASEDAPITSEYITTLAEVHDGVSAILRKTADMSVTEWRVLRMLSDLNDKARMSEIAKLLFLPANTVTWVADRLESIGYVQRVVSPETPQGVFLEITADGLDVLGGATEALNAYGRARLWIGLTEEQLQAALDGSKLIVDAYAECGEARAQADDTTAGPV